MKFTLSWLKEHLETEASLREITDTLTMIGLELEGVEDRSSLYANFVVAHVTETFWSEMNVPPTGFITGVATGRYWMV